jgi:photosystem II stability/assembly factor-like uncharacterized protein
VPVAPVPPGPSADLQSVAIDAAGLDGAGGGLWVVKNGALYRLAGGTGIWSTVNTSAAGVTFVPYLVRADPTLSGTAYVLTGDGQTVYRTPDGGSTWSSTGAIPFPAGQLPSYNLALKVLKQNGTTVLYYNYSNQTSGALLRWSSSNPAWALVHGETATTRSYNGYYPDATDVNTFYFDVQSQMFKSTDGFKTQTPLLFNTSGSYAYSFASDPRNPGTLWAGFFQPNGPGLAVSTDGGATWKRSDVGLGVSFPAQAEMYFAPGLILLNQRGHGLFRSTTNGLAP